MYIKGVQQLIEDVQALYDERVTPEELEKMRPSSKAAMVATVVIEAVRKRLIADGARPVLKYLCRECY
jgi:ribosomal 50S subunit-associated protein YjgA (DUF615 family)